MDAFFSHRGMRFHYREQGAGPALLILPGNTASSALHLNELDYFAQLGYRALSLDFAGTGLSDRLPRPWPLSWFQQNASDCAALLDHLGERDCVVCGSSGGAIAAGWMAILHPGRVRAVISDSAAHFYSPGFFDTIQDDRGQRTEGQVRFWSDAHGDDWQAVVDADTEFLLNLDQSHRASGGWKVYEGRLGEVRCPALFSCSLADDLIPTAGQQALEMASTVPGSWYFCVNGGGHPLMWSCPDAFRAAARSFLLQKDPAH